MPNDNVDLPRQARNSEGFTPESFNNLCVP